MASGEAYPRPQGQHRSGRAKGGGFSVYPASFEYFAPTTLDEALEILGRYDEGEAKILAGGQSLIPLMKLRFAAPRALVDINALSELGTLDPENGGLRVGALTRHKECERSELLRGRYGALGDAAPQISDPIVRNLGTVCGSLAHADPQGDWGSVMLAVGADIEAHGPDGTRTIPIEEFFHGPFTTAPASPSPASARRTSRQPRRKPRSPERSSTTTRSAKRRGSRPRLPSRPRI